MNGRKSPNTLVNMTTSGVKVEKILKKKKVLTTSKRMIMDIRIRHASWKGPYMI